VPDPEYVPITLERLTRDISIHLAAMRARKEPGRVPDNPFFAKALAERLLRSGYQILHRTDNVAVYGPSAHSKTGSNGMTTESR